jgi:ADP-ribose pyrophosphatase YjhB (NUDIX family)
MANDPFTVKGQITVQDSATVLLVRRRTSNPTAPTTITPSQVGMSPLATGIFGNAVKISFECDWEILLGQAEVINWLKTTPSKFKSMRYGGEWKLAGGNVDQGETIARAAARELQEEFL